MEENSDNDNESILNYNYGGLQQIDDELLQTLLTQRVHRLYLKRNLLLSLPEDIWKLSDLVEICLQCNHISSLPDCIGDLRNLEILDVRDNHLQELPPTVGNITSLKKLQISSNKIKRLPTELGNLKNLTTLEALKNELSYLPLQLVGCEKLTVLSLDRNFLQTLPRQLCQFKSLMELTVCANRLVSLPQTIGNMASLKSLYVDNNPSLMSLPASTFSKQVGFNSCAITEPSQEIIDKFCTVSVQRSKTNWSTIVLPPEIRSTGDLDTNKIPSLVELGLRATYLCLNPTGRNAAELPKELRDLLLVPSGHCKCCRQVLFVMVFPVVFQAQINGINVFLLGLCCSVKCVRIVSLQVNFPLLYPRAEDMFQALVPIS